MNTACVKEAAAAVLGRERGEGSVLCTFQNLVQYGAVYSQREYVSKCVMKNIKGRGRVYDGYECVSLG